MEYFILSQDKRQNYALPQIKCFSQIAMRRDFTPENCGKIKDINMVETPSSEPLNYLDVLDQQAFLVCQEIKKLFLLYDPSLSFKMFCMLNKNIKNSGVGEYYAPIFREIDCVAPGSEFNLDRSHIKKLVLFERKINHFPIFRVAKVLKETVIVRLDVAESLLRRKMRGLHFEPVEVYKDEEH